MKWLCLVCGFEVVSEEQPKCQRHSMHVAPMVMYEKSIKENGIKMEEVKEEKMKTTKLIDENDQKEDMKP